MTLDKLKIGQSAVIKAVGGEGALRIAVEPEEGSAV